MDNLMEEYNLKRSAQNIFIHDELGKLPYQTRRHFIILKYWLKVVAKRENKVVSVMHRMVLRDNDNDDRKVK